MTRVCVDCREAPTRTGNAVRCDPCQREWRLARDRGYRARQRAARAAVATPVDPGTCLLCRVPCEGVECADALGCARRASERILAAQAEAPCPGG
jgi:hypothetical protein